MKKKRHSILPVFSSQLTSTVSVAIVLFILGMVALLGIAADSASRSIREQSGFVAIMSPSADDAQVARLKKLWFSAPYVADVRYASADEVMARWRQMMGTDALPDEADLGGNPFFAEFDVNLRAEYTHPDSITAIVASAEQIDGVLEVKLYGETVEAVNRSIHSTMLVLGCIAAALMLISLVLINNTVRLAIYSRRFIIHTMKLVGATAGFIRRPFVLVHVAGGLAAAALADIALAAGLGYLQSVEPEVTRLVGWDRAGWVLVALFVAGALLSGLAALLGANRYIRISYDDLFD